MSDYIELLRSAINQCLDNIRVFQAALDLEQSKSIANQDALKVNMFQKAVANENDKMAQIQTLIDKEI